MSEEEIFIEGKTSCDEYEWGYINDQLTYLINRINPDNNRWSVDVTGFGWRNLSGCMKLEASTGSELISESLPDTECHFKIYDYGDYFVINNSHHDKPTGGEMYTFHPDLEDVLSL